MKKRWFKRWLSLLAAAVLVLSMSVPALAADPAVSATEANEKYYRDLGITQEPSLTINKFVYGSDGQLDPSQPISDVKFKVAKVGSLYEVKSGSKTVMAYGISRDFAGMIGLGEAEADYKDTDNLYFKDGEEIQNAVRNKHAADFNTITGSIITTSANGSAMATLDGTNPWGLYLVVETDVSQAKVNGDPVSITQTQAPFIAAIPTLNATDNSWVANVIANVKNNSDEAEIEKKVITSDAIPGTVTEGHYDDTDTTSIGDTVYFRLKGTVMAIPGTSQEEVAQYIMTDNISAGLDADLSTLQVKTYDGTTETTLTLSNDYRVSGLSDCTSGETAFTGGHTFTITFTDAGLDKLTALAKSSDATVREVYAYYSATVNEKAVIGEKADGAAANSGNPNQVKLTYQVSGSAQMDTEWDTVTEFTFGIDVTKTLENGTVSDANRNNIKFVVYSEDQGAKTYYKFTGNDGAYTKPTNAANKDDATVLIPDANGKIEIKGLVDGTYYVEEIATVSGYNLLKEPVEFKIQADKGTNGYVGNSDQYMGTINGGDSTGKMTAEIINTKGFTLPATGGAGIWMFVLGGMVIIAAGCIYFAVSKKKQAGK